LKNLNEIQFKEMVHKLALLHKLTKKFNTNNYIHKEPRTKEFCLKATKEEKKRFENKEKGELRFNKIKTELEKLKMPEKLTKGVIHGDFDKANIKFKGNSISGILDFDDSHYGNRIHDLGILILYWAIFYPRKIKLKTAKKIIYYYEEIYPLNIKEKECLFDFVKYSSLIIMALLMYDKWKGKDLFNILSKYIDELNKIGKTKFYNSLFSLKY
jgi:Ser/Thr protein kinase RdoA (MazF antagonist)